MNRPPKAAEGGLAFELAKYVTVPGVLALFVRVSSVLMLIVLCCCAQLAQYY